MFAARMDAVRCLFIAKIVGSTDEHGRSGYQKIAHQVFVVASFVHAEGEPRTIIPLDSDRRVAKLSAEVPQRLQRSRQGLERHSGNVVESVSRFGQRDWRCGHEVGSRKVRMRQEDADGLNSGSGVETVQLTEWFTERDE